MAVEAVPSWVLVPPVGHELGLVLVVGVGAAPRPWLGVGQRPWVEKQIVLVVAC